MNNPFSYSGIVTEDAFCNRQMEQKEFIGYIKNSQNVLLYSHRRYGKTSLIKNVFKGLENKRPKILTAYVDLFGTTSEQEFVEALFKGFGTIENRIDTLMKKIRENFSAVKINVSIDPATGNTSLKPEIKSNEKSFLLEDVFRLYENYSKKNKIVIAMDEFQELSLYGGEKLEKQIRKIIQGHSNICYIFAGSQKHILQEMFNSQKRALYKLAENYQLKKIATAHYVKWVHELFLKAGKKISKEFIKEAVSACENHPLYVQQFFYYFWEREIEEDVSAIINEIVKKRNSEFLRIWEDLTLNQRKTLKLVCDCDGKGIYYAENLHRFGFRTGSQVMQAITPLENKGILDKNGKVAFQDVIFKKWVARLL